MTITRLTEAGPTPAKAAGRDSPVRPYDLRHSFVSLLLAEGANVVEIARQAGHSATMTLSTYAHFFDEEAGAERVSAEDEIRRARQPVREGRCTRFVPEEATALRLWEDESPANPSEPTPGLEPGDPFITSVDQVSTPVAPSRAKPHESKDRGPTRWRPKTTNDKDVDPA